MISISVPLDFDLPRAVCSYGYFMLAPNRWDPAHAVLHTVINGEGDRPVPIRVRMRGRRLTIDVDDAAESTTNDSQRSRAIAGNGWSRLDQAAARAAVSRMLRIEEDFSAFHAVHPQARRARFGRLFRSATLFEDIVKTMTGCNTTWASTTRMNALLCEKFGNGGFPTPAKIAAITPAALQRVCKVGYRAQRIIRLAREVDRGRLDLPWFQEPARSTDELIDGLRRIHGIGPYAAANICHLLGRYDRIAIDSETYRHFRQKHNLPTPKSHAGLRRLHGRIDRHFAPFAPYQFLAYWFELWGTYEASHTAARPEPRPPVRTSRTLSKPARSPLNVSGVGNLRGLGHAQERKEQQARQPRQRVERQRLRIATVLGHAPLPPRAVGGGEVE